MGCTRSLSSSPSLDGPAEVGGVDSAMDMGGLKGDGGDSDDEEDEEDGAADSTLRNGEGGGGVLYDWRDPEARDSDSATVRGVAGEYNSGTVWDLGRVEGEGQGLGISSVVESTVHGA